MAAQSGRVLTDQALVASPPSPQAVLAKGFDPSRMNADWLVRLIDDWGSEPATVFRDRYPLFIKVRHIIQDRWPGESPDETTMSALRLFAKAIAMEAREGTDPQGLDGEAATARAGTASLSQGQGK